jgi:hypothetical protein
MTSTTAWTSPASVTQTDQLSGSTSAWSDLSGLQSSSSAGAATSNITAASDGCDRTQRIVATWDLSSIVPASATAISSITVRLYARGDPVDFVAPAPFLPADNYSQYGAPSGNAGVSLRLFDAAGIAWSSATSVRSRVTTILGTQFTLVSRVLSATNDSGGISVNFGTYFGSGSGGLGVSRVRSSQLTAELGLANNGTEDVQVWAYGLEIAVTYEGGGGGGGKRSRDRSRAKAQSL